MNWYKPQLHKYRLFIFTVRSIFSFHDLGLFLNTTSLFCSKVYFLRFELQELKENLKTSTFSIRLDKFKWKHGGLCASFFNIFTDSITPVAATAVWCHKNYMWQQTRSVSSFLNSSRKFLLPFAKVVVLSSIKLT